MGDLLEVKGLTKLFPIREGLFSRIAGYVHAVNGVSFSVKCGETLGIVGESGCGKSTMARAILRLIEPTDGEVIFDGKILSCLDTEQMRRARKDFQIVFQDPFASLNPRMTVERAIGESLRAHEALSGIDLRERIVEVIERVGLRKDQLPKYPLEFSGGQRQRIGIARALVTKPKMIIGDEPVSALDVSIRAQIINLLERLKEEYNLSYIIISHDLNMVEHISDRVGVMYLGRIVEIAQSADLYAEPLHPYTKALLAATPVPNPRLKQARIIIEGDVPSPVLPPKGCFFHPRCFQQMEVCKEVYPKMEDVGTGHSVACHAIHHRCKGG